MVRGFYAAASGALSQQKSINIISNNIANATTAGYKNQSTVNMAFGEQMIARIGADNQGSGAKNIGQGTYMKVLSSDYMDLTQGNMEPTGRSVDLAINGEGFFLIKDDKNAEMITRNGQFAMDKEGYLVLPGVGFVMNESKGKIQLPSAEFSVDAQGNITDAKTLKEKLYIAKPKADATFEKVTESVMTSKAGYDQADGKLTAIAQGAIEKSNVNLAQEMSRIIANQGNFQSCSQILKIYDRINEITANQIGRIG